MDAVAYQMSFNKEQLALLCANYDRRIDSLGAEDKKLKAENAKLRELVCMMLRVAGVAEYATDSEWQVVTDYLRELGIEVDG